MTVTNNSYKNDHNNSNNSDHNNMDKWPQIGQQLLQQGLNNVEGDNDTD